MPNYRRLFKPGGTFFFTVVTYKRQRLFDNHRARDFLHQCIQEVQKSHPFDMLATVLLPDHIHCIWKLPEEDPDFSVRWSIIKRKFSKIWLSSGGKEVMVSQSRKRHNEFGVWQRRFWEHAIRDEEDFTNHVNYIHFNPVKHGCVKCPHQWPYSSFFRWVDEGYFQADWRCWCNSASVGIIDFKDIEGCVGE